MQTVTIPVEQWEAVGEADPDQGLDGREQLLGSVNLIVLGPDGWDAVMLHVDAYEVADTDDQSTKVRDEQVGLVHAGVGGEGSWETVLIDGRSYVVMATPHC